MQVVSVPFYIWDSLTSAAQQHTYLMQLLPLQFAHTRPEGLTSLPRPIETATRPSGSGKTLQGNLPNASYLALCPGRLQHLHGSVVEAPSCADVS